MKFPRGLRVILTAVLCAASLPAAAAPGYRLVELTPSGDNELGFFDLNRRGEVVGMRSIAGVTRAFIWRAGQFTDLHDTIDAGSTYTQAVGLNDRSSIVAVDYTNDQFHGVLVRGAQVSPITVVPGEQHVFPLDINNRDEIIVDSSDGSQSRSYLLDGGAVQRLEGLPGEADSMHAIALNDRTVIAGNTRTANGTRAVLWQDGTIMNLGVVAGATASFASALNNRSHVVGFVFIGGGSQAMHWRDGTMSLLPRLVPNAAASGASSINDLGVIVGTTTVVEPEFRSTATLWFGSHVVDLNTLVRADDPLKPFVNLSSAEEVNLRGDIVASGFDSRTPFVRRVYFLTLFDN